MMHQPRRWSTDYLHRLSAESMAWTWGWLVVRGSPIWYITPRLGQNLRLRLSWSEYIDSPGIPQKIQCVCIILAIFGRINQPKITSSWFQLR